MARGGFAASSAAEGFHRSQRESERRTTDVSRIRRFVDEAWSELKKVSWPTREQVRNLTVLVFVVSFVVGVYITVLDSVFTQVVAQLVKQG
jgi:preprotein translocase subunit SecE